ncbi:protein of unknown function (plasmid) [Pararobbsia alpina]
MVNLQGVVRVAPYLTWRSEARGGVDDGQRGACGACVRCTGRIRVWR